MEVRTKKIEEDEMLQPLYRYVDHLLGGDWPLLTGRQIDSFMAKTAGGSPGHNWTSHEFGYNSKTGDPPEALVAVQILRGCLPKVKVRTYQFQSYRLLLAEAKGNRVGVWAWDTDDPDNHLLPCFNAWAREPDMRSVVRF